MNDKARLLYQQKYIEKLEGYIFNNLNESQKKEARHFIHERNNNPYFEAVIQASFEVIQDLKKELDDLKEHYDENKETILNPDYEFSLRPKEFVLRTGANMLLKEASPSYLNAHTVYLNYKDKIHGESGISMMIPKDRDTHADLIHELIELFFHKFLEGKINGLASEKEKVHEEKDQER